MRIVPFLEQLPRLRFAYVGDLFDNPLRHVNDGVVVELCDAYRSGRLPPTLRVNGIGCASEEDGDDICPLCKDVFNSFPISQVVVRETCDILDSPDCETLCPSYYDCMKIVARRPGGAEYLRSDEAVLDLLSECFIMPRLLNSLSVYNRNYCCSAEFIRPIELDTNVFKRIATLRDLFGARLGQLEKERVVSALKTPPFHFPNMKVTTGKVYVLTKTLERIVRMGIPLERGDVNLIDDDDERLDGCYG